MKYYSGSKTEFIRQQLMADPSMTVQELTRRWYEVSDVELNRTLYYQIKNSLGIKQRSRSTIAPALVVNNPYLAMERALDDLSEQADELEDAELSQTLRICRHHCSLQLLSKAS